jgi:RNA polymerase sigma-70 factor (ECF subfamily)
MSAAPAFRDSAATAEAAQAGLLYERYARQLLGFCRSRLSSQEEAEDAVQQTFLNAHRSLRSGTVPRAEAAWMYAIAANVCRERRRSAWRRSRVEVVSDDGLVGEQAAPEHSHEQLDGVADALAELTENQRRAILMREWQGLSYSEIATELALTQGAVETLLFRARRSLAHKLDRSRGRIWGIANLGSGLAWAKATFSGTAAQIAAATLVVAAGVTAASPVVSLHGSARAASMRLRPSAKVAAPAPRTRAVAAHVPTHAIAHPIARQHGRPVVSPPGTPPSEPVSAPVTVTQPTAPATPPVAVPPPPPTPAAPRLPPVEVPPVPAIPPVLVVPPVPPVSVPSLPLPDLPKLPKLP